VKRESLEMTEENWERLQELAERSGSVYSGKASWRRLILRIARGDVGLIVDGKKLGKPQKIKRRELPAALEKRFDDEFKEWQEFSTIEG
jgi:hypothetical protein